METQAALKDSTYRGNKKGNHLDLNGGYILNN